MSSRYSEIPVKVTKSGARYRVNVIYPEIELSEDDFYAISEYGDRWDKLALQFYEDTDYWWVIASANPTVYNGSLTITPGVQIRIPAYPAKYCSDYRSFNK